MKPSFTSAALFVAFTAPLHIYAQRHRGHGGPVVVDGGTVIVTEYLTVTGPPGGAKTDKVVVQSTLTPVETPSPGETPSVSATPKPSDTTTESLDTFSQPSTQTTSSTSLSESPIPTQAPTPTQGPTDNGGGSGGPDGSLTISITNSYGTPLSLALGSNFGGPLPDGNPEPTTIASTASYTFPSGWAGRIAVGKSLAVANTLIEASFGNGPCAVDVSYVDAYSVPITCSVGGSAVTGCNIELFDQGIECDTPSKEHGVCINSSAHKDDGPPPAFFAACEGAAYTFPNDNTATDGGVESRLISCCIGTSCPPPPQQKSAKRSLATRNLGVAHHLHSHQQRHGQQRRRSLRSHVHQLVQDTKPRK